jgi:uncharacterized membrane protein (UPF0182 family)
MFLVSYVILVLVASIPLAKTLWRRQPGLPPLAYVHRIYRDLSYIVAAVIAVIAFETALRVSLDYYWFSELGQQYRFLFTLGLEVAIFVAILIVGGLFIGLNLWLACRSTAGLPPSAPWLAGLVLAAIVASNIGSVWSPLIAFLGATASGVTDPVFGKDISFYLLALPLYEAVVGLATTLVVIAIAGWAFIGLLLYGPSLQFRRRQIFVESRSDSIQEMFGTHLLAPPPVSGAWLHQGMALGALFCLFRALARFLGRYHLAIQGHSRVVAGASWIDVHVWLQAYGVFILCWVMAAIGLACAAWLPPFRNWLFAGPSRWKMLAGLLVATYFAAGVVPALIEDLYVGPNQITLEQPFLVRSIASTRRSFGLAGPNVDELDFATSPKPIGPEDLKANAATLRDARIWDWRALEPQLQQIQGLRPYYTFNSVDIDRYQIDGAERQVMITARELNVDKLPLQAQVWVNLALKYTHGYGVVAVPVNEIDGRGNPVLWAHDIPIRARQGLSVAHGEIYYGLLTQDRVYVHTTVKEFDFPRGDANAEATYGGAGGIHLSSLWRQMAVARAFDGLRLFISDYFTPDSRILIRRNIFERVNQLAPFLTFDRDPYIVADGDHYSYIVDAYTSSDSYPYSEAYHGSVSDFDGRNYLRNSVKAVVDAYNGSVTFYVFDPDDPIIKAYQKMLPGLFRDQRAMPPNIRRHVRYPEDLFTVQAEMYGTYHMTNPTTFYNREDRWEVPHELYRGSEIEVQPYYVMAQLPHAHNPEFMLMLPLSVAGKNQMAAWLAGRSDGANYGKLVAYRFPKGQFVDGPAQVESRISSDSRFSASLTLWDQHGSSVIRGNLIILPLNGNQLVAIEPIYIEAEQTRIPTLARVVFGQLLPDDRKIEWASTLSESEALVAGSQAPTASGTLAPAAAKPDQLQRAQAVFRQMQQAYANGEFARAGELMQELARILLPG